MRLRLTLSSWLGLATFDLLVKVDCDTFGIASAEGLDAAGSVKVSRAHSLDFLLDT